MRHGHQKATVVNLGEGENGCFGREWMVKILIRKRKKEDTIIWKKISSSHSNS